MTASKGVISIFTVTDNHFTVLLAALLKSINMNHQSDEHINFYIVGDNLTPEHKANLEKCTSSGKITIFRIDLKDIIKDKSRLPLDGSSFPLIVYTRLFFPLFLPPGTEKVIYLDVDMIVRKDISLLWNIELGDKIIAGVPDRSGTVSSSWGGIPNYKELGIAQDTKYFNSGLLVINCKKWIEADFTGKNINCISENTKYANFPDQYGLNVVFANQWLELESGWNSYSSVEKKDPHIIHFIGIKPVYTSYNYSQKYKDEFYSYLRLTPWANFKPIGNHVRLLKKIRNRIYKKLYRLLTNIFKSVQTNK
ncbi:MAG: glycosyltransferase family 8 protein [Bacteroidales bacterium]|nr:glycosyltransferase family 8 protein [Bacteroidales bacterium]